ncbi:flagellar basal body rod protein [Acidovorax sp. HDW3]|uniref:flagellar basal body protein n=1 Tax=Acidovorax sp. HDW3 TaxID=2714923 RepID=UPI0014084A2F|nr:flagellar basal body protein [Acidovorax sp. HDW3]QIL45367.1 flagellar basal body rod protein [Acidovorax sp. HDW3]
MSSVLAIAASGMHAAQLRLESSAHNTANLNTPGFHRQQVQQQAAAAPGGVQAHIAQAPQAGVALEGEAVEQIAASYAFKANALVLRSTQSMLGSLLDLHA